jgi:hypothetical protein
MHNHLEGFWRFLHVGNVSLEFLDFGLLCFPCTGARRVAGALVAVVFFAFLVGTVVFPFCLALAITYFVLVPLFLLFPLSLL